MWKAPTQFQAVIKLTWLSVCLISSLGFAERERRAPAQQRSAPSADVALSPATPAEPIGPLSEVRITLKGSDLPLGAILAQIARSGQLALVAEMDVKLDTVVAQPNLDNLRFESALAVILTPFGYGYSIDEKAGQLRIVVFETRTFKLGVPVIMQQWESAVSNAGGSVGAGNAGGQPGMPAPNNGIPGNQSGLGSNGGMGASVSLRTRSDSTGGLWEDIEKSLGKLVGEGGNFSVNRVAGFVTVRALPSHMHGVSEYLRTVNDEMKRSVIVETKVIQVDLNDDRAAGIDWSMVGRTLSQIGVTFSGGAVSNFPAMAGSPATLEISGAVGSSLIHALETQGTLHMVAQPNLVLGNNLPAIINVAVVERYISGITTTISGVGTSQTSVQTDTISDGLVMSVLPRVMEDGSVQLALSMVSQDFLGFTDVSVSRDIILKLPKTSQRAYSGVVNTKMGNSVVIGGMISAKTDESSKGLPFLAKVPIIGWLFGYQEKVNKRTELVVAISVRSAGETGLAMDTSSPLIAPEAK